MAGSLATELPARSEYLKDTSFWFERSAMPAFAAGDRTAVWETIAPHPVIAMDTAHNRNIPIHDGGICPAS